MALLNSTTLRCLIAAAAVHGFAGSGLPAQELSSDSLRVLIRQMLERAPAWSDSGDVAKEMAYTAEALQFISSVAAPDSSTVRIQTSRHAVAFLEGLLSPDSVTLSVESDPLGFRVRVLRLSQPDHPAIEMVTDSTVTVPAGLYLIEMFNPVTGETRVQQRVCTANCRIRWRAR